MRGSFLIISSLFLVLHFAYSKPPLVSVEQGIMFFEADTTAHKMRLPVRIHELLNNPKFFEALPEYKELEKYKEQVVRLAMEHDSSKIFLSRDSEPIRIAGEMNGRYWRDFPDSDPLKHKAKDAFATLTRIDVTHEARSAKILFPNNELARKLAEELVKATDYDDVPKMRVEEFSRASANGHKMQLASEWIQKPEIKKGMTLEEQKRLLKLTKVLERPEFGYSPAVKYYTAERMVGKKFDDLAKTFFNSKYPSSKFELLAMNKTFSNSASTSSSHTKGIAGKVITKGLAAGTLINQTYQYAKNPDRNIPENFLKGLFFMSGGKPQCRGYYCHLLTSKCEREQQVEKGKADWNKCVKYFYTLSLDQQDLFLSDKDLKDSLQDVSPLIQDISCQNKENGKVTLSFEYRPGMAYGYQKQEQSIIFRSNGSIANVEIDSNRHNKFLTKVNFNEGNQPQSIQECKSKINCKNLTASEVQKMGVKSPSAKRLMSFMSLQSDNIQNCCGSKECTNYFEKKSKRTSSSALVSILSSK